MDDMISRQAAIDAIHCDITITGRQNAELVAATIGAFADRIKALPSAQPERNREMVALDMWSVLDHRRDDDPYVMGSEPQIEVTYDEQKRR